jgi:oxygen tolerance protein BatD
MKSRESFSQNRLAYMVCFLFVLLCTFSAVQSVRAAVEVSATLNARSFPLDRVAALTITVTGVRSFQPNMPQVEGIRFHQRGQSTRMEIINGAYSASVSSVFHVEALRAGTFTIPAIQIVTVDGTILTEAITFEVTASQTAALPGQRQAGASSTARLRSGEADKVAFLRVTPAKEKSYSGEIVPVQIKVYFRDTIKANLNSLPQLQGEGFVLQQLAREPKQTRELVNNTQYTVLTWDSALSGIKEGKHKLSVELEATLLLREQRRRAPNHSRFNDPFMGDSFFDSFFGSYREKEVKIASPVLDLTVLSLPVSEKPDTFSGAIGDFYLDVTASPLELEPGDPITLTMTVRGQGNFDRVQAPKLSTEKGWKSYTPSSEFLEDGGPGQGKKVFEQAIVAKDQRLQKIPAIEFSYFDPAASTYKTLTTSPIALHIQGAVSQEAVPSPVNQEKVQEKEESQTEEVEQAVVMPMSTLAPLQLLTGSLDQELTPLFARKWFQLLAVMFLLLMGAVLVIKVRAARYAGNPRLQRDQAMKHLLALRVKEIEQTLAVGDARGFLTACRRAIQEQLGLIWETEAGAITYADLEKRLARDSILLTVFRAADESAYGGQELSSQQMQEFADGLKKELEGLA